MPKICWKSTSTLALNKKLTNKKITITTGAPESPSSAQGEQPPCWLLLGLFRQQETLEDLLRGAHKVAWCLAVNWVWSDMMKTLLRKEEVTDLYICGIATDVCVGQWLWIIPTLTAFDYSRWEWELEDLMFQPRQRSTAKNLASEQSWSRTQAEE